MLENPKHEKFAQALASGLSASDAYIRAGYKPNRGNAARMNANEYIMRRVKELQNAVIKQTADIISFNAADMFSQLIGDIEDAKRAGDHRAAIDGRKFLLKCFGYEDSPTLTHEHVRGQKLIEGKDLGRAQITEQKASKESALSAVLRAQKNREQYLDG
jgi:hypothetical protein